ncbi:MAG: archaemetzincin family Zn-dependent metalloprotease [Candidatus Acidiferrales bacterium]
MNHIQLLPFGSVPAELLAELRNGLRREFLVPCELLPPEPDPRFAYNVTRQQFHSTEILAHMRNRKTPQSSRILGVTSVDLYIPILTFVFGEAQLQGTCALLSAHRLRQEFYGLPANPTLFLARLLKEAVHELGHTLSLTHCDNYECVMSPSHAVEWIDLKSPTFCPPCHSQINKLTATKLRA